MSSASRNHRRAHSSKVSYKDSSSDDDDEEFSVAYESIHSKQPENKDSSRRNLALKRISRTQERPSALDVLQEAIEKSLSQDPDNINADQVALDAGNGSKEVNDSEEDVSNVPCDFSTGDEKLRFCTEPHQEESKDAFREDQLQEQRMQIPMIEPAWKADELERQGVMHEMDQITHSNISKGKKRNEDSDWSSKEDTDDSDEDDDDDDSEFECESSDADHVKSKRKGRAKPQQKGKKGPGRPQKGQKPTKEPLKAPVKRPRSGRVSPDTGVKSIAKKIPPSKELAIKSLIDEKLTHSKEEPPRPSIDASKKNVMISIQGKEFGGKGITLKGCKSAVVDGQKTQSALKRTITSMDNASLETGGILAFSAQSPTGLHRRVIGLSRRFKPPPLHPYLSRMDG
ncbi:hypothetical protein KP509_02G065000 [Ceratopteris richardii]|uniref:Uncharacterized protein n=1 Tax=Ceratopteris richardii TaxID=49495 RepID=A0A8T2VDP4_CERRI|nr:hypothetical protein KP509_02G065000 [Ceratopteris richardii]